MSPVDSILGLHDLSIVCIPPVQTAHETNVMVMVMVLKKR